MLARSEDANVATMTPGAVELRSVLNRFILVSRWCAGAPLRGNEATALSPPYGRRRAIAAFGETAAVMASPCLPSSAPLATFGAGPAMTCDRKLTPLVLRDTEGGKIWNRSQSGGGPKASKGKIAVG